MAKSIVLDLADAENIASWILNHSNLPYGLATIAHALTEESEIDLQIVEDD